MSQSEVLPVGVATNGSIAGGVHSAEVERSRTMLPALNTLYQSSERRKTEMLAYLETLTDAERRTQPAPAEWSPLQVMEHIVVVEEWMAGAKAAPLPPNARILLKGYLFMGLGVGLMRRQLRMPTIPVAEPVGDLHYDTIRRRWDESRSALLTKLSAVTPELLPKPIALHPIAGPLNADQILELVDAHLAYHWRYFPRVKGTAG